MLRVWIDARLFDSLCAPSTVFGESTVDLEMQQIDLRYESLRVRDPRRERKLLASIGERGQLEPVAVVASAEPAPGEAPRYILVDGFARLRALRRLGRDTVRALLWELGELDALLVLRSLRSSESGSSLEEAWLLAELAHRFDLDQDELARRFDRSTSWVSRRLALVRELPDSVQVEIRKGRIASHSAQKYLVPMARANREDCERLARAIASEDFSTRDVGQLYAGWRDGSPSTRERLIENPALFLRVRRSLEESAAPPEELEIRDALLKEVSVIAAALRRARERLRHCCVEDDLTARDFEDLHGSFRATQGDVTRFLELLENHHGDSSAGPEHPDGDPRAA